MNRRDFQDFNNETVSEVARNLSAIMIAAEKLTKRGVPDAFDIYKGARDAMEALVLDNAARCSLRKMQDRPEMFQGYEVSKMTLEYMKAGMKINAIKEFRTESGLPLKEAKDWVEDYMRQVLLMG